MPAHFTQVAHPSFNPGGDERSENCGPTSLAMALLHLGLPLPALPTSPTGRASEDWLPRSSSVQQQIDAARYAMFSDSAGRSLNPHKAGLSFSERGPQRVRSAHQTLVNWADLRRGAENCGAVGIPLFHLKEVRQVLLVPMPVLLVGDPSAPGAPGPRLGVSYQGGHVVLAVGYQGDYVVHDPLCLTGQARVSAEEMAAFCGPRVLGDQLGLALFPRYPGLWAKAGNAAG